MNTWMGLALTAAAVVGLLVAGLRRLRRPAHAAVLSVGMDAPYFDLPDAQGKSRRLTDFRSEWLLLYFYPKDDTPGCIKEACAFREGYSGLRERGVQVVGISVDDTASHRVFSEKYSLPFPLLSDTRGEVAGRYNALRSWGPVRFAKRNSFLIDRAGRIAKIYRAVDAASHYREVLSDLSRLDETMQVRSSE